jgi:F-type H+-transporting ATPase subunit b
MSRAVTICFLVVLAVAGWFATPALAAEHAAEGATNINPLAWSRDLAVWTGAVFLLLLVVLWLFAWTPIAEGLQKREGHIAEEIESAKRANAEAAQLLRQYEKRLATAEEEVRQMLDDARREAEVVGRQVVEKARADAEGERKRAVNEIELATAGALKELAERSATLAVELAGRIVHERLDPAAHHRLIEQAVAGFGGGNGGKRHERS